MIRLSTLIGVYVILLIAAFNGATSLPFYQGKNAPDAAPIIRKAVTSAEKKEHTATLVLQPCKDRYLKVGYSAILQPNGVIINATAGAEQNFFTHSAILQHYINAL